MNNKLKNKFKFFPFHVYTTQSRELLIHIILVTQMTTILCKAPEQYRQYIYKFV